LSLFNQKQSIMATVTGAKASDKNMEGVSTVNVAGIDIPVLCADLNSGLNKVIISESVLDFLIGLLPSARLHDIKEKFIEEVRSTSDIIEFTGVLQTELEFHQSVNMIRKYYGHEPESLASKVEANRRTAVTSIE
jgi:hypothetical protein